VAAAGFDGRWLQPTGDDAADTLAALGHGPVDAVVVDHYRLDARWHRALRAAAGAAVIVIDDLADRPLDADLLVDPNPAADPALKYRAVLAPDVPMCAGTAYALLDAAYTTRTPRRPAALVQCIGIFMGGTDPAGHSAWALQVLRGRVGWTGAVRVASTRANPGLPALRQAVAADGHCALQLDQADLLDFHTACDLQLGAGGGALWERCALGVPTVALITADNQLQSVPWAEARGAVRGLDARLRSDAQADDLAAAVRMLLGDPAARRALHDQGRALVDGHGAGRVAARVWQLLAVRSAGPGADDPAPTLHLRPATLADAQTLLAWRNDPITRAASHDAGAIEQAQHQGWLANTLRDSGRRLWVACRADGTPVGTVRADRPAGAAETTLSWTVAPEGRGQGVGRIMVGLLVAQLDGPLHAEVKAGNLASVRIAQSAGLQLAAQDGGTLHFRRP